MGPLFELVSIHKWQIVVQTHPVGYNVCVFMSSFFAQSGCRAPHSRILRVDTEAVRRMEEPLGVKLLQP
jgi:hypothetical protein